MSTYLHKVTQPKVVLVVVAAFLAYAAIRIATLDAITIDGKVTAKCAIELISLFAQLGYIGALFVVVRAARDDRYFESGFVLVFGIPSIGASHTAAVEWVVKFVRPESPGFSLLDIPYRHGYTTGTLLLGAATAYLLIYVLLRKRYPAED